MISSMTGFGRSEVITENKKISVEMKSVNHRYLDLNIKMPKKLNPFESALRGLMKEYIERGKVDIYITYEDHSESGNSLVYNSAIAREYVDFYNQMSEEFEIPNRIDTAVLGRCPDVLSMQEQALDEDEMFEQLKKVFDEAVKAFVETRRVEGENLKADLLNKLDRMAEIVSYIDEYSPEIVSEYKKKLEIKIGELMENTNVEHDRIAMEVTIFADKICVDEEIVRLKSHVDGMKKSLIQGGAVGRKLDFVAQEMNREANTILSKAGSIIITDMGIELKTLIEKIREQIQNLE